MSKPQKPREEPKLHIDDLEDGSNIYKKKWPKDEETFSEDEYSDEYNEEVAGILEHPSYKELERKLTEAEGKVNEYWNLRTQDAAEVENTRRRAERDIANARKYALEKFVNDLLPVVDSLERALQSDVSDNEYAQKIHEGIDLTMSILLKTLEKYSVKQINPLGELFNPELHQAIATQPSDKPANIVLEVLQNGYTLNDRLIRPALVVVAAA